MVVGQIGLLKDWRELKLIGRHLIVAGLCRDAELVAFYLEVEHECLHTRGDCAEIVVFELLVFGALMTHESAAGEHQVGTCRVKCFIYKKIFLLPTQI